MSNYLNISNLCLFFIVYYEFFGLSLGNLADLDFEIDDLLTATATDADGNTSEFSTVTVVTGIEDQIIDNKVKIYPNPAEEQLVIVLSETQSEIATFRIFDLSGNNIRVNWRKVNQEISAGCF